MRRNLTGSIEILVEVNNAGMKRDLRRSTRMDGSPQWQFRHDVKLTGQFLCATRRDREFLAGRGHGRPNVSCRSGKDSSAWSSVHEIIPWAGHANYAARKGASACSCGNPGAGEARQAHPA